LENILPHHAYRLGGRVKKCGIVAKKCVKFFLLIINRLFLFAKKNNMLNLSRHMPPKIRSVADEIHDMHLDAAEMYEE
jgi:hypothetical protein